MNNTVTAEPFKFMGIGVQTTNENNQAAKDLEELWKRFYQEGIMIRIPDAIGSDIYTIYTDYEKDYTDKYTAMIGLKVKSLTDIPTVFIGREFGGGNFAKYTAKGTMPDAIIHTWMQIWSDDTQLNRSYDYDFEVYGSKSDNGENSEVEIYVSVK